MKSFIHRHSLGACALGLALAAATAGCGQSAPVGGLTNPNPGSIVDRDKPAARTDMPIPDQSPDVPKPRAEIGVSRPTTTSADPGFDVRKDAPEAATEPSANPPAKGQNSGDAAGATRPADTIKEGTPRSPQ